MGDQGNLACWLSKIESSHPKSWDLGLDRVTAVGKELGVLKPAPIVVLVAGTNGKGSTCEYLSEFVHHPCLPAMDFPALGINFAREPGT